jgi:hypothetical protein
MMQRPCKYCENGQEVMMETGPDGKWIVTNLDGTAHRHVKSGPSLTQAPKLGSTAVTNQVAREAQEERNRQIIAAHDENIEASKNQTAAIIELKTAILMLVEAIKAKGEDALQ